MSDLMDGGHCVGVKGKGWNGIACGVKGELTAEDRKEIERFARFLKSKDKGDKERAIDLGGLE